MSFKDLVNTIIVPLFNEGVIPLLYALAFLFFLVGMVRFFFLGGDEGREKGKQMMVWGIIGLFVIFGIWGIVRLLLATFSISA